MENQTRSKQLFGLWKSPISPVMMSERIRLEDVRWSKDGKSIIWLENRSGRGVLVASSFDQASYDLTVENNVRGGMGFGGGEFTVGNGLVVFSDKDGRLYRRQMDYDIPSPIIPPFGAVGSPAISPDGRWVVYVFSDQKNDCLAIVDSMGETWPIKLVSGSDFYMQPIWHPDGERIAWVEWDQPNMPWMGTRLKLAQFEVDSTRLKNEVIVAGNGEVPVQQPMFSPDGKWLSYISGDGEWDSLFLYQTDTGEQRKLVTGNTLVLSQPAWTQSIHTYGWNRSSERIYYIRYYQGEASLWSVDIDTGCSEHIDIAPYTYLTQLSVSPINDHLVCIASSPTIPDQIISLDDAHIQIKRRSSTKIMHPDSLSKPVALNWTANDGQTVYGFYYPPANDQYTCDGKPPVIINVHGGPSGAHSLYYIPEICYFTTRGYAWMEVNYRGSTGYGRSYQDALKSRWGELDVEDVLSAADMLVEKEMAQPDGLIIKGSSAGGFTTLNCLIRRPGRFKAAICLYGVANLFTLAMHTHKFEERINDFLLGVLPDAAEKFYDRSPIFHVDKIKDPIAIFQGSEDMVVPQEQSEEMIAALKMNKVPHIYRLYEGEGHGFRKRETIFDYLTSVEEFLLQYVIYAT